MSVCTCVLWQACCAYSCAHVCVCAHVCHGRLVGVRGQSFGEGFLFPFLWVLELPGLLAKRLLQASLSGKLGAGKRSQSRATSLSTLSVREEAPWVPQISISAKSITDNKIREGSWGAVAEKDLARSSLPLRRPCLEQTDKL